ncbi:MAG: DUF1206 domain-containing protein [Salinimicrobium sediminis]|uniref:DUF1206 domain-containing protein n=1 Tax=Salinimicrobium sediminis TaxID=1343891 RepID=A0A285X6G8_9FLAO|nr:DUF1206 domain-containing protein [Salinimicrobium sediminis]MDX1604091.1 DUF1206 domain-containing protein [Salinimicrobium sediminis]MDX1751868.1 DUF1206 domain-containing protein [Salinimicrobium sediminis]SOC80920.1 protein of unknown function [Salinimicrobium sediminis]
MDKNIKTMARTGFVAKGIVYGIIGILTFKAAFDMGGQKAGQMQVLEWLEKQTFGNILLVLMALGLLCYAAWRFVQAVKDPEHIGDDKKGKAKRTGFFFSGLLYLGIAVMAALKAFGSGKGSSGSSGSAQQSSFLASETGLWVLGIIGAGIIIAGIFQFVKAYKNDYYKKLGLATLGDEKKRESVKKTAEFGLSARGVILLIIGFFAVKAAVNSNPSEIKTTQEAFSFIQESAYGPWLMGLVAAGLIAYAVYMFLMAKYRRFQ